MLLVFRHVGGDARFVGHISDPLPFDALWTVLDPFTGLRWVTT